MQVRRHRCLSSETRSQIYKQLRSVEERIVVGTEGTEGRRQFTAKLSEPNCGLGLGPWKRQAVSAASEGAEASNRVCAPPCGNSGEGALGEGPAAVLGE